MDNYRQLEDYFRTILKEREVWRMSALGALACARLLPNYRYFQEKSGFGDANKFHSYIMSVWNENKIGQVKGYNKEKLDGEFSPYVPHTDIDYGVPGPMLPGLVQAVAICTSLLNDYVISQDDNIIINIFERTVHSAAEFICIKYRKSDLESCLNSKLVTDEITQIYHIITAIQSYEDRGDIQDDLILSNITCNNYIDRMQEYSREPVSNADQKNLFD